ncbi:ABC transporter permease [Luteimicrobium subarcticum]|uniref:Transport permease protein n=1 Tax=Luteimicrobium subarcticum TaxID=620910 RepID=A0A2M8W3W8_9MICO|nr:ABC transporter permease [Luteimicrobium subarcticum]PJI85621.1 ABC-2 type transport system permease protein [Luteimicrobium subarcticum]
MTTPTLLPRPLDPARASSARVFGRLLGSEARLAWRSGAAVFWSAFLPLGGLVVLGAVPGTRAPQPGLGAASVLDTYLPILMMFSLCISVVTLMPPVLAGYREKGILRRLSTTPVSPGRLLGAQATIYAGLGVVVSVVLLVVGVVAYDVDAPARFLGFVLALALVGTAVTGLGVVVAALTPSGRAANAWSTLLFFPLMFFAGLWVPRASMPSGLRTVSDWTPLGAGVRAVQATVDGRWPPAPSLLVLVGWTVACTGVALRTFRWE